MKRDDVAHRANAPIPAARWAGNHQVHATPRKRNRRHDSRNRR